MNVSTTKNKLSTLISEHCWTKNVLVLRYFYVTLMFWCCFLFLHEFLACSMVVGGEKTLLTENVKLHIVEWEVHRAM